MTGKLFSKTLAQNNHFLEVIFVKEALSNLKIAKLIFAECLFPAKFAWQNLEIENVSFSNCRFIKNAWLNTQIKNCRFVNCEFTENLFESDQFINCTLVNCEFKKVQIENCLFKQSMIDSVKFSDAGIWSGKIESTKILRCIWPDITLVWEQVNQSHFYQTSFSAKTFPWLNAAATVFDDCMMGECDLQKLALADLTFSRCQFEMLDISQATLTNVDFIESQFKKLRAVELTAEYLQMGRTAISQGDFNGMALSGAAIFTEAKLKKVTFNRATMAMSVFEQAEITDCEFSNAVFSGCNLAEAKLENVSFKGVKMANLHLDNTMLENVEGLKA